MNTIYKVFKRDVITELENRYKGCEYDSKEKLKTDIWFDSEDILNSCVDSSFLDVTDVGELAYSYLVQLETPAKILLEAIKNPEKILYYAYCAVLEEAVETFVKEYEI